MTDDINEILNKIKKNSKKTDKNKNTKDHNTKDLNEKENQKNNQEIEQQTEIETQNQTQDPSFKSESKTNSKDQQTDNKILLTQKEKKIKELEEENLLIKADMQNLKRRTVIDIEKAHKYALDAIVSELITCVDDMQRALESANSKDEALKSGIELTLKNFLETLKKHGVIVIEPIGETFDPNKHQAVSMSPDAKPNVVASVMQKGFELNGKLIRPAMVVVGQ